MEFCTVQNGQEGCLVFYGRIGELFDLPSLECYDPASQLSAGWAGADLFPNLCLLPGFIEAAGPGCDFLELQMLMRRLHRYIPPVKL